MRTRTRVVVAGMGAALAAGLLAPPAAAKGGVETVQVRDECDPEDFHVPGEGDLCEPGFGGDVSVDELIAALLGPKGARAMDDGRLVGWRNNPVETSLDAGEGLHVESRGGEGHTFSRVDALGGGCVPLLNHALGLPDLGQPGNNCRPPTEKDLLPSGATLDVAPADLKPGTNLFQCLFHPWMHTTVHVD